MRLSLAAAVPGAVTAVGVIALAEDAGGYYPVSWGWAAVCFLFALVAGLILRSDHELGRLDYAFLLGLAAYVGWAALSTLWGSSLSQSVPELQRSLVYLAAVAALLVLSRRSPIPLLAGVLAATVAVSLRALEHRVFPDLASDAERFGGRLASPLDYPNALALLAVLGILLAVGFLLHDANRATHAFAAAALVPLSLALYLTFSRGGVVALLAGSVVLALLERRPRALVTVALAAVAPALALWLAAGNEDVRTGANPADPWRLVAVLALLAVVGASLEAAARRRGLVPIGVGVVLAVAALALAPAGPPSSPPAAAPEVEAASPASGAEVSRENPADRLRVWRDPTRSEYWRVAWEVFRSHPAAGAGSGSYESHWYRLRSQEFWVRDAHSLVLETLAELGVVGAALLLAALAVPLAALHRFRHDSRLAGAAAAYVAFLVHASIDWDWELPAVTVAGLACGAALVVAARGGGAPRRLDAPARVAGLAAPGAAMLFALAGVLSGAALADAYRAAGVGDWGRVETAARNASRWAPWSSEAARLRGEAAIARGDSASARSFFEDAIARDGSSWIAWLRLGAVTEGRARFEALAAASARNPLHVPRPAREDP